MVKTGPGINMRPYSKIPKAKRVESIAQMVKHLPSK
jgi:hypothetical protein